MSEAKTKNVPDPSGRRRVTALVCLFVLSVVGGPMTAYSDVDVDVVLNRSDEHTFDLVFRGAADANTYDDEYKFRAGPEWPGVVNMYFPAYGEILHFVRFGHRLPPPDHNHTGSYSFFSGWKHGAMWAPALEPGQPSTVSAFGVKRHDDHTDFYFLKGTDPGWRFKLIVAGAHSSYNNEDFEQEWKSGNVVVGQADLAPDPESPPAEGDPGGGGYLFADTVAKKLYAHFLAWDITFAGGGWLRIMKKEPGQDDEVLWELAIPPSGEPTESGLRIWLDGEPGSDVAMDTLREGLSESQIYIEAQPEGEPEPVLEGEVKPVSGTANAAPESPRRINLDGKFRDCLGSDTERQYEIYNTMEEDIYDFTITVEKEGGGDPCAVIESVWTLYPDFLIDDNMDGRLDGSLRESDIHDFSPDTTTRIEAETDPIKRGQAWATTLDISLDKFTDANLCIVIQPTNKQGDPIGTGEGSKDFEGKKDYKVGLADDAAQNAPFTRLAFSGRNATGLPLEALRLTPGGDPPLFSITDAHQKDLAGDPIPGSQFDSGSGTLTFGTPVPHGDLFAFAVEPDEFFGGTDMVVTASVVGTWDAFPFIDPFETPQPPVSAVDVDGTFPVRAAAETPGDDIIGGNRDVLVVLDDATEPGAGITWSTENGVGHYQQDDNTTGQLLVHYDSGFGPGVVNATTGFGDIDLTNDGTQDGLRFVFEENLNPFVMAVLALTDTENSLELSRTVPAGENFNVDFRWDDLTKNNNGDPTNISASVAFFGLGGMGGRQEFKIKEIVMFDADADAVPLPVQPPGLPFPLDGALNVPTDTDLSWASGGPFDTIQVGFGVDPGAIEPVATLPGDAEDFNLPDDLLPGQEYSWNLTGMFNNAPDSPVVSDTFRFKTIPEDGYQHNWNPSPTNGAVDVPTGTVISWSAVPGALGQQLLIGAEADNPELFDLPPDQTTHDPCALDPDTTYSWMISALLANEPFFADSPVFNFTTGEGVGGGDPPGQASNPDPSDGATDVDFGDVTLRWTGGEGSDLDDVLIGADADSLSIAGTVPGGTNSFHLGSVAPGTTNFWQINGRNDNGTTTGPVWSFTTALEGEPVTERGSILFEYYLDMLGTQVEALTSHPAFPEDPDHAELLSSFEGPVDRDDNYGTRARGFLHPETTGDYVFWVASDDASELFINPDGPDPDGAQLIAENNFWTSARRWDEFESQKSHPVHLEGGEAYYIEALCKEGGGGDNLAVAWKGPDSPSRAVIDGSYLSPAYVHYALDPTPVDGATNVAVDTPLVWNSLNTTSDQVLGYGSNAHVPENVITLPPGTTQYDPGGPLEPGQTTYWNVNGGPTWEFTTAFPHGWTIPENLGCCQFTDPLGSINSVQTDSYTCYLHQGIFRSGASATNWDNGWCEWGAELPGFNTLCTLTVDVGVTGQAFIDSTFTGEEVTFDSGDVVSCNFGSAASICGNIEAECLETAGAMRAFWHPDAGATGFKLAALDVQLGEFNYCGNPVGPSLLSLDPDVRALGTYDAETGQFYCTGICDWYTDTDCSQSPGRLPVPIVGTWAVDSTQVTFSILAPPNATAPDGPLFRPKPAADSSPDLLPDGLDTDIGDLLVNGQTAVFGSPHSEEVSPGTYEITASGSDIWDASDQFHYVHLPVSTPEFSVEATVTPGDHTNAWTKAGIMARKDLTPGSENVFVAGTGERRITSQVRLFADDESIINGVTEPGAVDEQYMVRLDHFGGLFFADYSPDGEQWYPVSDTVVDLGNYPLVGLAVTSHNNNNLFDVEVEATIDFFDGQGPQSFTGARGTNVGSFFTGGVRAFGEDGLMSENIGNDVWGNDDNFTFHRQRVKGNFDVSVLIQHDSGTEGWAKGLIMARETEDSDSKHVSAGLSRDGRAALHYRAQTGDVSHTANTPAGEISGAGYVRLKREGNVFTAYYSEDGENWNLIPDSSSGGEGDGVNPLTVEMSEEILLGLAHTSHNALEIATAVFRQLSGMPVNPLQLDFNRDCNVDFKEFSFISMLYGASGSGIPVDVNGDGIVDFRDIQIIATVWLMCEGESPDDCFVQLLGRPPLPGGYTDCTPFLPKTCKKPIPQNAGLLKQIWCVPSRTCTLVKCTCQLFSRPKKGGGALRFEAGQLKKIAYDSKREYFCRCAK
jgi:hypothetical protein